MVVVPAGSFMMGFPEGGKDRERFEGPQHRVFIAKPFAVGKFEVTFAEWNACVSDGGCSVRLRYHSGDRPYTQGWNQGLRPVINVNWIDANRYVAWLSDKTQRRYRLLSESEWEYVARAGSTTRYGWGDDVGQNNANCDGCGSPWDNRQTAPVGSFRANKFGLHDLHGNVWEWVEDCWNWSYSGAPTNGDAWTTGDCSRHVLRGGAWDYRPKAARSASRSRDLESIGYDYGFRVARDVSSISGTDVIVRINESGIQTLF